VNDDHFFLEELEHAKDKKGSRKERKRLSDKDRSKYKKTDTQKLAPSPDKEGIKGRVVYISPEGVFCQVQEDFILCSLKGLLKKKKNLCKNLIACGDQVVIQLQPSPVILQILPRKTVLSRADNLSRKKEQVIAANIDQVFITVSILEPVFKPFLIDRYLIAASKGHLTPIILITKMDLIETLNDEDKALSLHHIHTAQQIAHSLNIPLILLNQKNQLGFEELKAVAAGKTSVFSGQSGVGKSTLINFLTEKNQKLAPVVAKTQKGAHTTTRAIMLGLKTGHGFCVDTPGIRSFGLWDLELHDIGSYFKEIQEAAKLCKFPNCRHMSEPDCNVKLLCTEGLINPLRFESYLVLMEQTQQQHKKR
jgi:ribosome biogenesis GTPase